MASIDRSYICALGPIKLELTDVSSYTDGDTITSRLQRPLFATHFSQADLGGTNSGSVTISGRTLTLRDANPTGGGADNNWVITFGF